MNNHFAFLPMVDSSGLLDDQDALRKRFDEDGYLLLRGLIEPRTIRTARLDVLRVLADAGWVNHERAIAGRSLISPLREEDAAFQAVYDGVQRLESFHSLAHHPSLLGAMQTLLGDTAFPHPLKIARLSFPDHYEASTPPHQDYPNNQGTERLTAAWVPLGAVPAELGGLAILRGSHHWGQQPLAGHIGPGNRQAVLSTEVQEACRWVATEFEPGDVLVFGSMTVHASLHNASEFFMRLSVDFRYQCEGEALTEQSLHPHFRRLTWDEICAADWRSDELQRYWEDLDFEVVPFEDMPLIDGKVQSTEFQREDVAAVLQYARRRDARVERRMAALEALLGDDGSTTRA